MSDDSGQQPGSSFTGIKRQRRTRFSIKLADIISRILITCGGVGTICAVGLVCIFLVVEVLPLFMPGKAETSGTITVASKQPSVEYLHSDEYRLMTGIVTSTGHWVVQRSDTGEVLHDSELFPGAEPTAWSFSTAGDSVAVGFADGSVRLGSIGFQPEFLRSRDVAPELRELAMGEFRTVDGGIVERTPEGQLRRQVPVFEFSDPVDALPGKRIVKLDHLVTDRRRIFTAVAEDGSGVLSRVRERKNLMTGKVTLRTRGVDLPNLQRDGQNPIFVGLTGLGDNVWVTWANGHFQRIDTRNADEAIIVEELDLERGGIEVTACRFANGKATLLVGDAAGHVSAWFTIKPDQGHEADLPADGAVLTRGHLLDLGDSAITSLGVSSRTRLLVAGLEDGTIRLVNITTEREVATVTMDGVPGTVAIAPKDDGFVAIAGASVQSWSLDAPYHEVSPAGLILPVHYESYTVPETVWQSSSGDDAFEPKYGMWPLIFGTLKATFYALVFGAPVALLAAVYTSEFLSNRVKSVVKPGIEMMASLPSVVLGFIGGLVVAVWVEQRVMAVVLAVFTIPFAYLLFARFWQLIPRHLTLRSPTWVRLLCLLLLATPAGVLFAKLLAAPAEWAFFGVRTVERSSGAVLAEEYDLVTWLSAVADANQPIVFESSGVGGWMFLCVPLAALFMASFSLLKVTPWLRQFGAGWDESRMALVDLLRFVLSALVGLVLAWVLSLIALTLFGDARTSAIVGWLLLTAPAMALACYSTQKLVLDRIGTRLGDAPWLWLVHIGAGLAAAYVLALIGQSVMGELGPFLGTFIQRNALVVGFIMGFAIIPIIYTIAEDALSAVPNHLRSGSLGAGATPWQTAMRIVIPTAMSGIFSAIMIGLGRAVGETMIVLMATGNTPVKDWNLFNGLRTLSANIAVELPEAPKDETHYRTLFLAALVLFAMTFLINTVAEVVRLRFRKRAFEL